MFASLQFEKPPVEFQDLPSGVVEWVHVVGGLSMAGLVVWLLAWFFRRRSPEEEETRNQPDSRTVRLIFVLAFMVAAGCYLTAAAMHLPEWMQSISSWMSSEESTLTPKGQTKLEATCLLLGGAASLLAATIYFLVDLVNMRWRRIWALGKLSFKEAIRRRVLWVFSVLIIVFLFGSWFLPYDELKPDDQIRNYVTVVFWAKTPLLLVVVSLLAALSIPTDIKQQTIHTILTKPVERFEIVLGRFIGFSMLMTVVLAGLTAFSLIYVFRGVDPDAQAESLKARVPLYGNLEFERVGVREAKGENVGKEWDYRSYISGPMPGAAASGDHYAIWNFDDVPSSLGNRDRVRCEYNFDIYRTTKGEEKKGVFCIFTLETRNWNASKLKDYREERRQERQKGTQNEQALDNALAAKYGFYESPAKQVYNNHTMILDLPADLFKNAVAAPPASEDDKRPPLRLRVQCVSRTQFLGMAKYDLYFRLDEPDSGHEQWLFAANFFKASFGLWLRLVLVIGVAVACSTYLNGPISWICTIFLFIVGLTREFVQSLADGTNFGGGPLRASLDLVQARNPLSTVDTTATTQLATGVDEVFRFVVRLLVYLIPDVDRYDFADKLREGFDIGFGQMFLSSLMLAGYLLPWAVVAYYLIRSREIASS